MNPSTAQQGVSFPDPESWANIVRDCKLTDAQANRLEITLKEALDYIDSYYSKLQNRPRRTAAAADRTFSSRRILGLRSLLGAHRHYDRKG